VTFAELGIGAELAEALAARNIRDPSEIQKMVIPGLIDVSPSKPNLLFSSPTGTGKTLAYALPMLRRLYLPAGLPDALPPGRTPGPAALVLAPTYELCSQIKSEFDYLLGAVKSSDHRAALVIGSVPLNRQIDSLKKQRPSVVVGNPARVLQLVRMKKLSLKALRYLVLDEGDRLMADEFFSAAADLCRLAFPEQQRASADPPCEQTPPFFIACSATFSGKNRERLFSITPGGNRGLWEIAEQKENDILRENIDHWAFFAEDRKKISMLRSFIAAVRPKKLLVFTARAARVGTIVSQLQFHHLSASGLWGDMDKKDRKRAIDGFRKGNVTILVSSDLAARGLDIEGISHIAAMDIPDSRETYIHRAGRTARAGRRGVMASFGDETELRCLSAIEKKLGIAVYPKELYNGRLCVPEPYGDEDENPRKNEE
jgi:superfamily II DNA/RNA helicase